MDDRTCKSPYSNALFGPQIIGGDFYKQFAIIWSVFKPALSPKFHIPWNATLLHCGILTPICKREIDVITTAALLERTHLVTVEVSCMGSFRWETHKRQWRQPDWNNLHRVVITSGMKTMVVMDLMMTGATKQIQNRIRMTHTIYHWFAPNSIIVPEDADGRMPIFAKCLRW